MLELPESNVMATQLNAEIVGKRILNTVVGASPHRFAFFSEDVEAYQRLRGLEVESVSAVGGMVDCKLGRYHLLFADGANLHLIQPDDKPIVKHQFCAEFVDGSKLMFSI